MPVLNTSTIYVGNTAATKVYLGSTLVWEATVANTLTLQPIVVSGSGAAITLTADSAEETTGDISTGSWETGFYSEESYTGDVELSWICGASSKTASLGFCTDPVTSSTYYQDSMLCWTYCRASTRTEYGSPAAAIGAIGTRCTIGDAYTIKRVGTSIIFIKNGVTALTLTGQDPSIPVFLKGVFDVVGAKVTNLVFQAI